MSANIMEVRLSRKAILLSGEFLFYEINVYGREEVIKENIILSNSRFTRLVTYL